MIDVVIPYFDAPERLASILLALDAQVDPATGRRPTGLAVIVADDASNVPPDVTGSDLPVRVVRHEVVGYHAAATRDLGVSASTAEVVVLLDGDTVPAPEAVARLVAPILHGGIDVTTGRRRHADLGGLAPDEVARFVADPAPERVLTEPEWLRTGLERTDRLRSPSAQVYQYVISAVMAVRREVFVEVGGFDHRFDTYGGEDWELASRLWNAGAEFEHVIDAVAFHDGPDIEGRLLDPTAKTIESLRIADLVPASATRRAGVVHEVPDLDVRVHLAPGEPVANAVCVISLLSSRPGDLRVGLVGAAEDRSLLLDHLHDPRVVDDRSGGESIRRLPARADVTVTAPVEFDALALHRLTERVRDGLEVEVRACVDDAEVIARSRRLSSPRARARRGAARAEVDHDPRVVGGVDHGIRAISAEGLASWMRSRPVDGSEPAQNR
ncbi:glycosyltransferase [Ilumatobacter sp.]|uniref:glycosyltransferase n=1 Tax=Ilumatobacter sp. TaxID=1967498 RepID=UPI003B51C657